MHYHEVQYSSVPINTANLLTHPTMTRQFFGKKFLHTFFFPGHCCSIFLLKGRTEEEDEYEDEAGICLQLLMVAFQATLITMSSSAG